MSSHLGEEPARHVEAAVQHRTHIGCGGQRLQQRQDSFCEHPVIHIPPAQCHHHVSWSLRCRKLYSACEHKYTTLSPTADIAELMCVMTGSSSVTTSKQGPMAERQVEHSSVKGRGVQEHA